MSSTPLKIGTADGTFTAYVAQPARPNGSAVLVLQEIFGVNAIMRALADDFAAQGYLAVCPDLFWRIEPGVDITDQSEAEWAKAFALYKAFDVDLGLKDIAACLTAVRDQPGFSGKIGSVGFCLGGLLAYLTATRTDIDAAIGYYGVGIDGHLDEAAAITRPLMLHIAEADSFVPEPAQAAIARRLITESLVTLHTYPGRDHAFARKHGAHYDASDAALAWTRSLAFVQAHLV